MLAKSKNSKKARRSESAESITLVLKCISKYIDLLTFKVGFYHRDGKTWFNLSYKKICEQTGLSLSRVRRALEELQRVGLLAVHPISEEVITQGGEKRYYSKPAIKTVNLALFALFGLADRVLRERDKASKRFKRKEEQRRTDEAKESVSDVAEGLSGLAMAKAVMQAAKYAALKNRRSKRNPIRDHEIWDDPPY